MEKIYLLNLSGFGGDHEEKYVNQETWDWIFSNKWQFTDETSLPKSVLDNWEDHYGEEYDEEECGFNDDDGLAGRAMQTPPTANVDESKIDPQALRDTLAAQGFELVDTYEGQIF